MTNGRRSRGPDIPADDRQEVPEPSRRYDAMHVMQCLMELQKDLGSLTTKTDRLISDVSGLSARVDGVKDTLSTRIGHLEKMLTLAQGFAFAAMIFIPICFAIVWWAVGSKIEQMRDDLLGVKKPAAITQQSSPIQIARP